MDDGDLGRRESDAQLQQALELARRQLYTGESPTECEECGERIPEARRKIMPGCTRCVACQTLFERGSL